MTGPHALLRAIIRLRLTRTAISWLLFGVGTVLVEIGELALGGRLMALAAAWQVPTGFADETSVRGPYLLDEAAQIVAMAEAEGWDPRALERLLS